MKQENHFMKEQISIAVDSEFSPVVWSQLK